MAHLLGKRIAIIGPSASGKSTLTRLISQHLTLKLLHLDQIAHKLNTNWEPEAKPVFHAAQTRFLEAHTEWVIEGNYGKCMPERLSKADTVIWCDPPLLGCIWRYIKRCNTPNNRVGGLKNADDPIKWKLIWYILHDYRKNRSQYRHYIQAHPTLNVVHLKRFKEIKQLMKDVAA